MSNIMYFWSSSLTLYCLSVHKAREELGGKLQGLCGDMNGERLFEFRSPRRCVLPSGELMAAQYQTQCTEDVKDEPASSIRHPKSLYRNSKATTNNSCPKQEGTPTSLRTIGLRSIGDSATQH